MRDGRFKYILRYRGDGARENLFDLSLDPGERNDLTLGDLPSTALGPVEQLGPEAIEATAKSISQGDTIAEPLKQSGVFPPMVVQMIGIGEQTGALDEMLSKVADFYDDEVDAAVEALTAAIEPVMIVVMGTMVGGMLVAMYLPMFKMANVAGGGH